MGLFGPSKKDKQIEELQAQLAYTQAQLTPEQQEAQTIEARIASLQLQQQQAEAALQEQQRRAEKEIKNQQAEIEKRRKQLEGQNSAVVQLQSQIAKLQQQVGSLNDEIDMQEYGIYRPTYDFANSDKYKEELKHVRQMQKDMIKAKTASTSLKGYQVNGSSSQGKKMVEDMQKLLLRAFNSECDDIIAHVRISNKDKAEQRIHSIADSISKLGKIMQIAIAPQYVGLKIRELSLALDFAQKKEEEKERLRELKAQEREEAKARKEIEEARKKLEKEQTHYQNALKSLSAQLEKDPENADLLAKKAELEADIADTEKAIADVDYREANRRAGYVYVISNIGAFGEGVYKIGMTRRLEPMDRINELGDASVPFSFDVHALIFTEDAPGLEAALHTAFEDRKVNRVNPRREFFRVSLEEIKQVVRSNFDKTVEWVDVPEAEQYRQSLVMN